MTATPLRIDFVSDIACPWCVIGLKGLLKAIDAVGDGVKAEIRFLPFELNPGIAPEGENTAEHVAKKYGSTRERSDAIRQVIAARGAELGFTFNYGPESRIWNTFDAHRMLHWAGEVSADKQLALKLALFKATFTDQRPSNDPAALLDAVRGAGLDVERARAILAGDEFAAEVRGIEAHWAQNGINAVPSVIFNGKWLIQGGQPPELFERVIRDVISGKAKSA